MLSRRKWLSNSLATVVGTALLAPAELRAWQNLEQNLADQLLHDKESEAYWELVKNQFVLEKGLYYFNNGSLGTSPEYVVKATEQFRRTLDGFPSRLCGVPGIITKKKYDKKQEICWSYPGDHCPNP